jgi:hypothetical protein
VTGMRGRHSTGAPGTRTWTVLQVLGGALAIAAVLVGIAFVWDVTMQGSSADQAARSTVGQTSGDAPAGQLSTASSAPIGQPTRGSTGSPRPAAAGEHADPFGTAAASYLSTRAGIALAAVYDVTTGQTWRLGQGQPQAEASVVKLDVLETLLAEQGGSGLSASDRSLAQEMIEESDNTAATSLWYEVGGGTRIRSFNALVGLTHTTPSSCVVCSGFPWPGWGLTTTTPADQLALLRELVKPSSLITKAERDYALSLMENVTPAQRWGVSGGVPAQVTVALKNGWLPLEGADSDWQINSVGWISGGGRDYLMAVLSTGNPTEQYGIDTIDQLATMVWQNMK